MVSSIGVRWAAVRSARDVPGEGKLTATVAAQGSIGCSALSSAGIDAKRRDADRRLETRVHQPPHSEPAGSDEREHPQPGARRRRPLLSAGGEPLFGGAQPLLVLELAQ